ncbi:MAG: cyclic nucleotide-binding domain-containing protein [Hyphomicrobiaceae bacterium]|nr:cyclic nucleotide-binding domain-containing protein [Hyphomicrobiaceae bacterium]
MSIEDEIRTLRQIPMFRDMEVSKLKLMAFAGQRITYRKDEVLFDQGAASDAVYIVLEGEVDVVRSGGAGDVLLARLGETELIGEMGVLCDKPRTARIVAHTDVQALRIDKMTFNHIVQQVPQLAMAIIRELSERLENVNERLAARGK